MIFLYGARLARGCTSGQALSGGAVLSVGSWAFALAIFASAYAGGEGSAAALDNLAGGVAWRQVQARDEAGEPVVRTALNDAVAQATSRPVADAWARSPFRREVILAWITPRP